MFIVLDGVIHPSFGWPGDDHPRRRSGPVELGPG
jgi:hypothetical protein